MTIKTSGYANAARYKAYTCPMAKLILTGISSLTGLVKGTAEKLKAYNGEHQNGEKNEKADLK